MNVATLGFEDPWKRWEGAGGTSDSTSTGDLGSGAKDHRGTWPPNTEGRWKAKGHQEPNHGSPEVPCPSTFAAAKKPRLIPVPHSQG